MTDKGFEGGSRTAPASPEQALARLEDEVRALRAERAATHERAREQIRRERERLKAEVERVQARTRPLLERARREIERLTEEHALMTRALQRMQAQNEALRVHLAEIEADTATTPTPTPQAPLPALPPRTAPPLRTGTDPLLPAIPTPPGVPPVPARPPRPGFVKQTKIVQAGQAAVWLDTAKDVALVDVTGKAPQASVRQALRSEDLESRDLDDEELEEIEELSELDDFGDLGDLGGGSSDSDELA